MENDTKVPAATGGCSLDSLVMRLETIAKKNNDEFCYTIEIDVDRRGISYRFVATEEADGHEFLTGAGATIEAATADAAKDVEDACEQWSYKVA